MADIQDFTPGPWFAKGRYIGTKNHMSFVGECRDVNGNWSDDAKSRADAKLMAAAPELLDAGKSAASWMERWASHAGSCKGDQECTCGLIAIRGELGGAIAKATGGR